MNCQHKSIHNKFIKLDLFLFIITFMIIFKIKLIFLNFLIRKIKKNKKLILNYIYSINSVSILLFYSNNVETNSSNLQL